MYSLSILSVALLSAVLAAPVSGYVVPRQTAPSTYAEGYLEPYKVYHTRYLAIGCQNQHSNATFFNACCHPMLATESLETARPSWCIPSASASASASAAEPTSTVVATSDDGDDEDCDDGDDEGEDASSVASSAFTPAATSTHTSESHTEAATTEATTSEAATTSSTPTPSPISTQTPTSTKEADPTTSSSSAAQASPTSGSDDSSSSEVFTGGSGTWFTQNGVAGACGTVHPDSDMIVAIDQQQYGNSGARSATCGKTVEITANGKTATAVVADDCPTCNNANSLDMSTALFQKFAPLSVGLLDIKWKFV